MDKNKKSLLQIYIGIFGLGLGLSMIYSGIMKTIKKGKVQNEIEQD